MFGVDITVDTRGLDKVIQKVQDAARISCMVGISGEATNPRGENIAEYARYNEFGTKTIPARPFMRQSMANNMDKWKGLLTQLVEQTDFDMESAYELFGEVASKDIQMTIEAGKFAPNAPSTVERKRRRGKKNPETPLIDYGDLQRAITYKIISRSVADD